MRVLVTGAAGFIGSATVDALMAEGMDVRGLDNFDPQVHGKAADTPRFLTPHLGKDRFQFVKGDLRNRGLLKEALDGVDAILHLAAAVGVGQSMYRPEYYMDVNARGTAVMLDVLANEAHQVKKIVVASSMSIYGEGAYANADGEPASAVPRTEEALSAGDFEVHDAAGNVLTPIPTPEDEPLDCTSIYAISKKVQEEMTMVMGKAYGIPAVAMRYFNVYGPRQSLSNPYTGVAAIFISRFVNGKRPTVFEDGAQSRDFVHVRDVAKANVLAVTRDDADGLALNVGTGRSVTVMELARSLGKALDKEHLVPDVVGKFRPGDVRHCIGDVTRIRETLGYEPSIPLEEGLGELIDWAASEESEDLGDDALRELSDRGLVR